MDRRRRQNPPLARIRAQGRGLIPVTKAYLDRQVESIKETLAIGVAFTILISLFVLLVYGLRGWAGIGYLGLLVIACLLLFGVMSLIDSGFHHAVRYFVYRKYKRAHEEE